MFGDLGKILPAPTRIVILISNIVTGHFIEMLIILVTLTILGHRYFRSLNGAKQISRILLRFPGIRRFYIKMILSRFSRSLCLCLGNGMAILPSLDISVKSLGNIVIEKEFENVISGVRAGLSLSSQLSNIGLIPRLAVNMIKVGERTGELSEMMGRLAEYYDQEVDMMLEGFTAILEPLLILILGIILGFIVISLYMPILDIGNLFQ
jgi:type IV pilus assembly protein PilC